MVAQSGESGVGAQWVDCCGDAVKDAARQAMWSRGGDPG